MTDTGNTIDTSAYAVLRDAFERVAELVPSTLEGVSPADLRWQPGPEANPIGWLIWHLTRVQDDHVADLVDAEQVWTRDAFEGRFALPYETGDIGYGHSAEQVEAFAVDDLDSLIDYHAAVHTMTLRALDHLSSSGEDALARVIDERWDPPVTALARLVSVIGDTTQHVGQAAYVRGLLRRS